MPPENLFFSRDKKKSLEFSPHMSAGTGPSYECKYATMKMYSVGANKIGGRKDFKGLIALAE
eukprot:1159381-Pelagomonas_calceolata.AAC.7